MPLELNVKNLFQDFNPSKFIVYGCLLIFCLLFALRLDEIISWSFWTIFLPLWIWKALVIIGAIVGSWVWFRHPQYRMEGDSYTQYKAMVIAVGLQLLLLMFELMVCDKLESQRPQMLWILIFIPLFCISVASIGLCVWALKHGRTFELELFCSVNILQFIFLALKLDGFIQWRWVIIFIPIWIVMCVALVGVVYAVILAIILLRSADIIPEQRRSNVFSAIGYTCMVVPLLVFSILLTNKLDRVQELPYLAVTLPLFVSLFTLMLMAFGARGGNQWWFGIRKEFCPWLLGICPILQEYGNISYNIHNNSNDEHENRTLSNEQLQKKRCGVLHPKKHCPNGDDSTRTVIPTVSLDMPD